jgi:hypothetical protein
MVLRKIRSENMTDHPEDRDQLAGTGQPGTADAYCTTCRQVQLARMLPAAAGWACVACGDPPAAAYAEFAAWARGTAPVPPEPDDASRAFPGVPGTVLAEWFARLGNETPDDEEILARYAAELPACGNCRATAALADMRGALRCVLLPWLEDQGDPVTARRLRRTLEDALDEVEDQIDVACG